MSDEKVVYHPKKKKHYVVVSLKDRVTGKPYNMPIDGPFDTKAEAEAAMKANG